MLPYIIRNARHHGFLSLQVHRFFHIFQHLKIVLTIRAYDPCLSCATHALGKMPLEVSILDHEGKVLEECFKG